MCKHNNNNHAKKAESKTNVPPVASGADLISQAIFGLFENAFAGEKKSFEDDMFTLAESVKTDLNERITDISNQIANYKHEVAAVDVGLANHKNSVNAQLGDGQKQLTEIKKTLSVEITQQSNAIVNLESGIRDIEALIVEMHNYVEGQLNVLGEQVAIDRTASFQERLTQLATDIGELYGQVGRQDSTIGEATNLARNCQSEIANLGATHGATREMVSELSQQVDSLRDELRDLSANIALQHKSIAACSFKAQLTRLLEASRSVATTVWSRVSCCTR